MNEQDSTEIFQRIWYLPDNWWTGESHDNLEEWCALLKRRNARQWNVSDKWREFPHIYLVHRPLTFGHSQLVLPIPKNLMPTSNENKESLYFECASIIIKRAIKGFVEAFHTNKLHTEKIFSDLAKRTHSYGEYEKTIIMRVSANENPKEEYKVHLVPYFESNADLCQKRYYSIHRVPDKRGGLIGWLGDTETEVDCWQLRNDELSKVAKDIWKLPELAVGLRAKLACQQSD